MTKRNIYALFVGFFLMLASCKKQDGFLNQKPNASLNTISTLNDCQLLLQNESLFNDNDAGLDEIATDELTMGFSYFQYETPAEQNSYLWAKRIDPAGNVDPDYAAAYQQIYVSNTVLDALPNIHVGSAQQTLSNQVKGEALFYRSWAFYNMVQEFAMPYDSTTAASELGIPLRLTSNINEKSTRASEKDCYDQILNDLKKSASLLPKTSAFITLPSQLAAYGALARIYLSMGSYNNALQYANLCLSGYNQIVDYNTISTVYSQSLAAPGSFVAEDIYHSVLYGYGSIIATYGGSVDPNLYALYDNNDLRKSLFFDSQGFFIGSYDYLGYPYSGIATDEMYLIRAECNARENNVNQSLNDLNTLLTKRYKSGTFVPYAGINADNALKLVLTERRKELLVRGVRWSDLRRLNKDPQFAITLTRTLNGVTYTLPPNDPKYAFPFDDQEIKLTGIQQNQR